MNVMMRATDYLPEQPGDSDGRIHGLLLVLAVPAVTKFVTDRVLSIQTEMLTTATKEAADPSLVAIAAFPEVAEKAFSEGPRCSSPRVPRRSPVWIVRQGGHDTHQSAHFGSEQLE